MDYDLIAEWYDSFVRPRKDLAFYIQEAKKARGDVLDLMCGTGRVAIALLKEKVRLTGVDVSPRMLWFFHQKMIAKGLFAQTYNMDITEFRLVNRFGLIFIALNSFAEIHTRSDRIKALERIYDHLKPGGNFLCALHNPELLRDWANGKLKKLAKFTLPKSKESMQVLVQPVLTPTGDGVTGKMIFERFGERNMLLEKKTLPLQLALIDSHEFESMCTNVGLRKVALWGDYSRERFDLHTSPSMIWKMRRPRS
jgi:SAM-dependent methyltransferase